MNVKLKLKKEIRCENCGKISTIRVYEAQSYLEIEKVPCWYISTNEENNNPVPVHLMMKTNSENHVLWLCDNDKCQKIGSFVFKK